MGEMVWQIQHSVDANVSRDFAFAYMTEVANWDDPPASFELDGSFSAGARGTTRVPGQDPLSWTVREVTPPESYVIAGTLDGAVMCVTWRFDPLPGGATRLTQRLALEGEKAAGYAAPMEAALAPNLAPGMARIAAAMERAARRR